MPVSANELLHVDELRLIANELCRIGYDVLLLMECDRRSSSVSERKSIRVAYSEAMIECNSLISRKLIKTIQFANGLVPGCRQGLTDTKPEMIDREAILKFIAQPASIGSFKLLGVIEPDSSSVVDWSFAVSYVCLADCVGALLHHIGHGRASCLFGRRMDSFEVEPLLRSDALMSNIAIALKRFERLENFTDVVWNGDKAGTGKRKKIARVVVMERYGVKTQTISDWIKYEKFPKSVSESGGKHVYWEDEVEAAMNELGIPKKS